MNNLSSEVAAGASYATSLGSGSYWLLQLLDKVSPSQWAALGVLASILLGLLTYLTNLYFKIKEDRRKEGQRYAQQQD
ncbi:TPA: class II holin family protein [Yersinia enterocolitica]|nr:class II holin family protein [Yersinia enterocolitica]